MIRIGAKYGVIGGGEIGLSRAAAATAISVLDSNVKVDIGEQATLDVGRDLYLQSETIDRNITLARSTTDNTGQVGVSIACCGRG